MNDITPTHSVRCESTAEIPKKIVFFFGAAAQRGPRSPHS